MSRLSILQKCYYCLLNYLWTLISWSPYSFASFWTCFGSTQTTTCMFFFFFFLREWILRTNKMWKMKITKWPPLIPFQHLLPEWRYSTASTTKCWPTNCLGSMAIFKTQMNRKLLLLSTKPLFEGLKDPTQLFQAMVVDKLEIWSFKPSKKCTMSVYIYHTDII